MALFNFNSIGAVDSIGGNLAAADTARILSQNAVLLQKSLARLSAGLRIVSAGDDPAGAATDVRLEAEINRISAAQANVTNASSYVDTQAGFLTNVQTAINRMSELTVLSQDEVTTTDQRAAYQEEFSTLQNFVSDVGTKQFNGIDLFSSTPLNVTIDGDANTFTLDTLNYNATAFSGGLADVYDTGSVDISTTTSAASAETTVNTAVDNLSFMAAKANSNAQFLSLTRSDLATQNENLAAADNAIIKVNTATESVNLASLEFLVDSGTSMLSKANELPSKLLTLFNT